MRAIDHAACSGCGLCQLVCPAWRRHRDVLYTPHGRAKAIQHGATAADLADSLASCSLCGACDVVCPERITIVALTLALRGEDAATALPPNELPEGHLFALRQRLGPGDLLVIEPRAYHRDYERQVLRYEKLRALTGCMTSLDLQRIAIPADDLEQARWILQGRQPRRIVVEREQDRALFAVLGDWPVLHVTELIGEAH